MHSPVLFLTVRSMAVGRLFIATNLALILFSTQAVGEGNGGTYPTTDTQPGAAAVSPTAGRAASAAADQRRGGKFHWEVQVAAMKEPAGARVIVDRLAEKGYRAFVLEARDSGDPWHRVRIGGLRTRSEAQALAHELIAHGFEGTFVPMP